MFLLQMDKNPLSLASMHYCLNNSNNDNFNSNFCKTPHNFKKTCLNMELKHLYQSIKLSPTLEQDQ